MRKSFNKYKAENGKNFNIMKFRMNINNLGISMGLVFL